MDIHVEDRNWKRCPNGFTDAAHCLDEVAGDELWLISVYKV
jgi:hypothetical protein